MTFEEIKAIAETWFEWPDERRDLVTYASAMLFAHDMYERGQAVERERIKSRVKEAAESLWCIRNQGDAAYELYIGPSMNTLEQFVEKLLEE